MAHFEKISDARLRADHDRSMTLIGNGGIIVVHPLHAVSKNGMHGKAIMEHQRSGMLRRVYSLFILSCLLSVVFFLISQTNLNRISLYQQQRFRALEYRAASTSTTTTSSATYSTSFNDPVAATAVRSKDESMKTFVVQDDLFNNNKSKVTNKEEAFELDNLGETFCGVKKCFVRLKSNKQVGYLLMHKGDCKVSVCEEDVYKEFKKTWTLAKHLKEDYDASTLLLEPPLELLDKDKHFVSQLNAHLAIVLEANNKISGPTKKKSGIGKISTGQALVVQKVQVVPKPNMFWHIWWKKSIKPTDLKVFMHFLNVSVTGDKGSFSRNLLGNLSVTRQILQDKKYACLNRDFQFIIDYEGEIHHLDLDRCFESYNLTTDFLSSVNRFLNTVEDSFKKALRAFNVSVSSVNTNDNLRPSLGRK
jgi:hypothetical protein